MLKKILFLCLLILLLAACSRVTEPAVEPTLDATGINATVVSQITSDFLNTQSLQPTETPTPLTSPTPIPTLDRTRPLIATPTSEVPCNRAAAGHPLDITIPDGSVMAPGESFSKTWRLKNTGNCTWTRLYAVTFFSGNSLNAQQTHTLLQEVAPGQEIDVTIDMEAPEKSGTYQSNWMLSDPQGNLFGIGPNGDAPFWVQIEVVPVGTETPQPNPTLTQTPVIYLMDEALLASGDQLDLDSGDLNPDDEADPDLVYEFGEDPTHTLTSLNDTGWVIFGDVQPTFNECTNLALSDEAITFNQIPVGTYICYRTSGMLPGWLLIEGIEEEQLSISFLTWSIP